MPQIDELLALYHAAVDRGSTLMEAEASAYHALLDLAAAGIDNGQAWDTAQTAHYRAVQAIAQQAHRTNTLGAALVEAVRCLT